MAGWKTVAIVLIVIQVLEIGFVGWGMYLNEKETDDMNLCYYDQNYCGDYPEADIVGEVCTCYDYDVLGEFVAAKTYLID